MSFFTWAELKTISNRIACDTFVRNHKITNEADELFRPQELDRKDKESEPEPDLQVFEIRMKKPIDLEQEIRDELKKQNKSKKLGNCKKAGG